MLVWKEPKYKIVTTTKELIELASKISESIKVDKPIALDVETTGCFGSSGLDYYHGWLLGMSFCLSKDLGYYIPFNHIDDQDNKVLGQLTISEVANILNPVLSTGGLYLGHNIKFDYKFLWQAGIKLYPRFWDTCTAIQVINGDTFKPRALKKIIKDWVSIPSSIIRTFEDVANGDAAKVAPTEMVTYAVNDSIFTYYLYEALKPIIDSKYKKLFYEGELPLIPLLAHMEMRGIKLDSNYYQSLKQPLIDHREKIKKEIEDKYSINIASPSQVLATLKGAFSADDLPYTYTTDEKSLKAIMTMNKKDSDLYKFVSGILDFRKSAKVLNTYIIKYVEVAEKRYEHGKVSHHILHTDFDQIKNSGRMSSSPNVQNIPRDTVVDVRKGFVARDGYKFIDADWSSAELRLVTIASKEPLMTQEYVKEPRKADLHTLTAKGIFDKDEVTDDERHTGKTLNFSVLYGATEFAVSNLLKCSKEEAKEHIDRFYNYYSGISNWKNDVKNQIKNKGFTSTFYGRRRYLPKGVSPGMQERWKFESAVRMLTNHIIQGTCADILKFTMVKLGQKFAEEKLDAYLISTTHDSIVVEAHENCVQRAYDIMKGLMELKIDNILLPIDIDIKSSFSKKG